MTPVATKAATRDETFKQAAIRWLAGQQPVTVLLFCILGCIGYVSYYALNTALPSHIAQVAAADEARDKRRSEELKAIIDRHEAVVQQILERDKENRESSNEQRQKDRDQREKDRELIFKMWDTIAGIKESMSNQANPN